MNYFLFKLRRFIARTFHLGCQICRDGKIEMNWWQSVCPICWRKFPSPAREGFERSENNVEISNAWHQYLNPEFRYEEWKEILENKNDQ